MTAMLIFALLTGAGQVAAEPAASPSPAPTVFDFRDFRAGELVQPDRIKSCGRKGAEVTCWSFRVPLADVTVDQGIAFYNDKLSWVYVTSDAKNHATLLRALDAKYGKICDAKREKWRNAAGLELDNLVATWCFSSGKLTLRRYGSKLSETSFEYQDDNRAPAAKPKVDF